MVSENIKMLVHWDVEQPVNDVRSLSSVYLHNIFPSENFEMQDNCLFDYSCLRWKNKISVLKSIIFSPVTHHNHVAVNRVGQYLVT